jgi:hypothetical protein
MSVEIAWKENILVTDSNLLKLLLVVLGFGSQTFICGFSRQNINSVFEVDTIVIFWFHELIKLDYNIIIILNFSQLLPFASQLSAAMMS